MLVDSGLVVLGLLLLVGGGELLLRGTVGRLDGLAFLAVYVGFTAYLVALVRGQMTAREAGQLAAEARELGDPLDRPPRLGRSLLFVGVGVVLLTAGAYATVTGASGIGRLFGLSERVIGLTIVAAGTGLPEVVTSVVSSVRGWDDVAIGNVIGSNLFNVLAVLGLNALVVPLPIAPEIATGDNWWMLGVTLGLFPLMVTGRRISRFEGGWLLAVYGLYLSLLLAR